MSMAQSHPDVINYQGTYIKYQRPVLEDYRSVIICPNSHEARP